MPETLTNRRPLQQLWRACLLVLALVGTVASSQGWEDGFAGNALAKRWQWRVPVTGPTVSLTDRPGWLRIRLPERVAGFNHWNEPQPVDEAPQLRAAAPEGDWEFEARLQLPPTAPAAHFQVGVVAILSDGRLLSFGPLQGPTLPGGPKVPEVWLEPTGRSGFSRVPGEARDIHLRLLRTGALCRAQSSRNGQDWTNGGAYLLAGPPRWVGLIGKTFAGGSALAFDVDYARLTVRPQPEPAGRRALVGVGGEYPTGYRGLLARLGLPHEVLVDHQLADAQVLRRFDLLLVSGRTDTVTNGVREALMAYVRAGGTAVLDSGVFPPAAVVAGKGGGLNTKDIPDIVVGAPDNPLAPFLGGKTRFAAGESRYHYEPASLEGLQVLARFDGRPGRQGAAAGYTGTPAVWAKSLGSGLLVYSSPAIGATLSWGPSHDALAEALIRCLGWGRLEPQLTPEGARFGRKQSEMTAGTAATVPAPAAPAAFTREKLPFPSQDLPEGTATIRGKAAPEFNLSGAYHPGRGKAALLLNHWSSRYQVALSLKGASARLTRTENGRVVDSAEVTIAAADAVPFVVRERRDRIVFVAGTRRAAIRADGLWEGKLGLSGDAVDSLRYQPVEPPFLADDFMRGEKEQGAWEIAGGQWAVRATGDPRMGANPFSYRGQARGLGVAVAGLPFWDDYAFAVSVRAASATGAVAQGFYWRDRSNHFLFRVRLGDAVSDPAGGAELVRVTDGKEAVLARGDGCLVKGQWYRLSVRISDGAIRASVDGAPVVTAEDRSLTGGRAALCVCDGDAEFDDVLVRSARDAADVGLTELDGSVPRFAGTLDRDTWAGTALQWRADPAVPGQFWRRGPFYGDVALSFRCALSESAAGPARMTLLLAPTEDLPQEGLEVTLASPGPIAAAGAGRMDCDVELAVQGRPVGQRRLTTGAEPLLELRRTGQRLEVLVDGVQALEGVADEPARACSRLGFRAEGFRPRLSGLRLAAGNVLDYCFDRAPADWWVGSGTWELAVRWPCTPEWSWLAGESREIAALWHKRPFAGNVLVDLHVGPRTVDHGDGRPREICRAFNLVLCGDGKDVNSGYSVVLGAGKDGVGATLTRNGHVVLRNPAYRVLSDAHNQWLNVRGERLGSAVRVWVGDQEVLAWEDPEPLAAGRVAVWTRDNAVMIPRVTIYCEES